MFFADFRKAGSSNLISIATTFGARDAHDLLCISENNENGNIRRIFCNDRHCLALRRRMSGVSSRRCAGAPAASAGPAAADINYIRRRYH